MMPLSRAFTAVIVLLLLLSACSQPTDVQSPNLEPQFGTALRDRGDAVAYDPKRGVSYVAGVDSIQASNAEYGSDFEGGGVVFVRAYTKSGQLTWQWRQEGRFDPFVSPLSVDDAGNLYFGWSEYSLDGYMGATVVKLSPTGRELYRLRIDNGILDLEADKAGNVHLAGIVDSDGTVKGRFLRKYGPGGRLLWERRRTYDEDSYQALPGSIAAPYNLSVAEDGSIYVAGATGTTSLYESQGQRVLTKYSAGGRTLWQRTVPSSVTFELGRYNDLRGQLVSVGGGSVYLAVNTDDGTPTNRTLLLKYTEAGAQVWQRTVLPQGQGSIKSLDAGRDGLAYLAGYTRPDGTDKDAFARRYNASGTVQWTFAPRLKGTDEVARAIDTRGPANVYLAGVTNGKVNGKNLGRDDAFLIRLNEQGRGVWSR